MSLGPPSRPPSLTFHCREDSLSGPPSTSGYPRDVTCPTTLLRVQPYISHMSSVTRSVTSHSGFLRGLLPNLRRPGSQFSLPASWLYPSRLLLTQTSPVSSDRLAVWVGSSCRYLASCDPLQDIKYSLPVQKVTVHVCAVKRLHTTNSGLKINNFLTPVMYLESRFVLRFSGIIASLRMLS